MRTEATPPAIPTIVQKVADYYRPDLVALGAAQVVAKPAGVLVVASDAARAGQLAALLAHDPHGVPMQVAFDGALATPAALSPGAIADVIAGAHLAGVAGASFSTKGVVMGMRIPDLVHVHVAEAARADALAALFASPAGAAVPLRVSTDPLPEPGQVITVRPSA